MGDGNIMMELNTENQISEENKVPQAGKKEQDDSAPQSSRDEDSSTPTTPTSLNSMSLEMEELHRSTVHSVNTTATKSDISSASICDSPTAAEGEQPITPRRIGRRNFRAGEFNADNEFGLPLGPAAGLGPQEVAGPDGNQAIFSVRGTRSFKINRHRDSVSVFPSGCMGVKDSDDEGAGAELPTVEETVASVPTVAPVASTSPPSSPSITLARPSSAIRNPLTGEGYGDKDYKRQSGLNKKRVDGNPVMGTGYDPAKNTRGTHVPPGGYSSGLW